MSSLLGSVSRSRILQPVRTRVGTAVTRLARQQVEALRNELRDERTTTEQSMLDLRRRLATIESDIEHLAVTSETLVRTRELLDDALAEHNASPADLARALSEFLGTRHTAEELAKLRDDAATLENRLENRVRELSSQVDMYRGTVELLLGAAGRFHSRLVDEQQVRALVAEFGFVGDVDRVVVALNSAYRTIIEVELRGVGRLAGSTENLLAKLAAVSLLDIPSPHVLEIGALFGLGAAAIARQLSARDIDAFVTMVDPFAGYQMQPDRGPDEDVSQVQVTQSAVVTNMRLGGIPFEQYRLVEGRSSDAHVRDAISDRRYGLVVIDGDHSMDTALEDLLLAESLVEPGALVLLDDVGDPAWPGVAEALAEYEHRPRPTLHRVGTVATTALLRAVE